MIEFRLHGSKRQLKRHQSYLADGATAQVQRSLSLAHMTSEYGHPWLFFHRVDLHNGLKELAFDEEGEGPPVVLKLQSKVTSVVCSSSDSVSLCMLILYRTQAALSCILQMVVLSLQTS